MQRTLEKTLNVEASQQGSYLFLPFDIPEGVQKLRIKYSYQRYADIDKGIPNGVFKDTSELNIIDLGLISPHGHQIGASGSEKNEIEISETFSTPGYSTTIIYPGTWQILAGIYKVDPNGLQVHYEIIYDLNGRTLFRGDLHTHTLASDGVHTLEELAFKAKRNKLDFVAITDHNNFVSTELLARFGDVTLIPGVEWTHYRGHANFLGLSQPYEGSFAANSLDEIHSIFTMAHQRGATIVLNHPFDESCGFTLDWQTLPFHSLEVWNGPMRESNLKAVGAWQKLLSTGQKISICGGSDYHRDTPFIFLGGPTMGLFAPSRGISDLMAALRAGHGYITFSPNGPHLEMNAGAAIMGDSVSLSDENRLRIHLTGLLAGDVVRVVKNDGPQVILQAPENGNADLLYPMDSAGFARVEVLRSFLPGLPMLPALLSNPIYFNGA